MIELYNSVFSFLMIVSVVITPVIAQEAMQSLPGPIPAKIVRVIDGDTLAVRAQIWVRQQVDVLVRIRGVDAPELKGQCEHERQQAMIVRRRLEQLIADHDLLFLEQVRADKYGGRVVARVLLPKEKGHFVDVGAVLLQEGLVHPYNGTGRLRWCP